MDGSTQSAPGIGVSVDYENDDQIALGLAVNPLSSVRTADYMTVYAKHRTDQTAQDFDIWSVRVQIPAPYLSSVCLPLVSRRRKAGLSCACYWSSPNTKSISAWRAFSIPS